jgi:hypothetical protein
MQRYLDGNCVLATVKVSAHTIRVKIRGEGCEPRWVRMPLAKYLAKVKKGTNDDDKAKQ